MGLFKKILLLSLCAGLTLSTALLTSCKNEELKSGTITFKSKDEVTITADLYIAHDKSAPFIILFHQASYSRGEYIDIAPRLNNLGFNCMAIDQRSGIIANDVINETHNDAVGLGKEVAYVDALPDMEAALEYVRDTLKIDNIIVWGSSYSSSLALVLGQRYPEDIDGILSFSPGEYFTVDDQTIEEHAKAVKCPVFITSTKSEYYVCKPIYENLPKDKASYFLPESQGTHGSRALWETSNESEGYWEAVEEFLEKFKK